MTSRQLKFVVGNGVSRRDLDWDFLKARGEIWACNAAYRTHGKYIDHLVTVDYKMVKEVECEATHLFDTMTVWTQKNQEFDYLFRQRKFILIHPNYNGDSSGNSALMLASKEAESVFIFGFDYLGIPVEKPTLDVPTHKQNNMFVGTKNYAGEADQEAKHSWRRQTRDVMNQFPNVKYVRVTGEHAELETPQLVGLPNYREITYPEFYEELRCIP